MSIWCPLCMPEHDFDRDASIVPVWCSQHAPTVVGEEDRRVTTTGQVGYAEAGGEDNRRWCDLLHRGVRS